MMTANGEVRTNKEATVCVKQLDLFVTVILLEETPAVLSLALRRSWVYLQLDQWSKSTSPKMEKESIATKKTTDHSLSLACRRVPVLPASTASSTSSSQDTVISTENLATESSEIMSEESR